MLISLQGLSPSAGTLTREAWEVPRDNGASRPDRNPATAYVLTTETRLAHGIAVADGERAAFDAFRRVWQAPTDEERAAVLK